MTLKPLLLGVALAASSIAQVAFAQSEGRPDPTAAAAAQGACGGAIASARWTGPNTVSVTCRAGAAGGNGGGLLQGGLGGGAFAIVITAAVLAALASSSSTSDTQ